jgi:hypothetical protein
MKSTRSKYLLTAIILIIAVSLSVYFYIQSKKVAPVEVPIVKELENDKPSYKIIGKTVEGRNIESYTYGSGKYNLVFVGGIHGGYEWNSVLLAYQFLDYLDKNPNIIPENVTVTVIPSMNPDGLYRVTGKEGRFSIQDVSTNKSVLESGRFNANNVDLNRNFDCKWQPESKWKSKTVSAGKSVFSEPEALAIKNFVEKNKPSAVIFWHSQSNAVYASACKNGILTETTNIMNTYSKASGYPAAKSFDSYVITGDAGDWLSTINIPSISVELKTHETIEFDKNILGIKALLQYYGQKS